VAATLTAQAVVVNPGVTVAPTDTPVAAAPSDTPVPPTETPASAPCFVAIGYLTTLLCQNGPDQFQLADTSAIGPIQRVQISSDGTLVAYTAGPFDGTAQLWIVNGDGTHAHKVLDHTNLPPNQPDTLSYPRIFQWQAGTHTLFLDTSFMPAGGIQGPGEYVNRDLWKFNADTNDLTQILTPDSGGYFSLSPDGGWVAVTRPQDVSLISSDGAVVKPNLITFPTIITYSEYLYKPEVTWSPDSSFFTVNIPSNDPMAADASATIYKVQVDGTLTTLKTIAGQFMFDYTVKISPDGQWVAYSTGNADGTAVLHIESLTGPEYSNSLLPGAPTLFSWSPDSQLFGIYLQGGGLQYSGPGAFGFELQPLAPDVNAVTNLVWSDATTVVFSGTINDHWGLRTAPTSGAGPADLAGPFGYEMVFDLR
jgi:hypothetical protein